MGVGLRRGRLGKKYLQRLLKGSDDEKKIEKHSRRVLSTSLNSSCVENTSRRLHSSRAAPTQERAWNTSGRGWSAPRQAVRLSIPVSQVWALRQRAGASSEVEGASGPVRI